MSADLETLARTVKAAQYRQHRAFDGALATIGTTLVQWDALRAVSMSPGASAHDLAVATFQTDQAFGTLANRLEAQGLIHRRPGVGRRIAHHLTPAGQRLLADASLVVRRVREQLFAPLTEEECGDLQQLLSKLLAPGHA